MTDVDSFGITFPKDLDCRIKAVLIGAAILIVRKLFFTSCYVSINEIKVVLFFL